MTIVGLSVTYPAVRETISLCYYIRKVYKSIGFPFSSERLSMIRIMKIRIILLVSLILLVPFEEKREIFNQFTSVRVCPTPSPRSNVLLGT